MCIYRKIKGSGLADSYKNGWELALNRIEENSSQYLQIRTDHQIAIDVDKAGLQSKKIREGIFRKPQDTGQYL